MIAERIIKTSMRLIAVTILCLSGVACASHQTPPSTPRETPPPPPQYLEHQVQFPGETLGIIAKWYTGKASNWTLIKDANPGLKPERMRIGDVLQIPQEIVIEQNPLPRSQVRVQVPKPAPEEDTFEGAAGDKFEENVKPDEPAANGDTGVVAPPADVVPDSPPAEPAPASPTIADSVEQKPADVVAPPTDTAPAELTPPPPPPPPPTTEEDAEREKLLEELLDQ